MMLLGLVFMAVAFADPQTTELAVSTTTVPSAIAPGVVSGTTAPVGSGGVGVGVAPERLGRSTLRGFGEAQATITDAEGKSCQVCVLLASTPEQRERGLMEVTDESLGGYSGMLFEYPMEIQGSFWMRNTPMPLQIAYFDGAGDFVSSADTVPCGDDPDCPSYPAEGPFQFALEVPQGRLDAIDIGPGSTLLLTGRTCPLLDYDG